MESGAESAGWRLIRVADAEGSSFTRVVAARHYRVLALGGKKGKEGDGLWLWWTLQRTIHTVENNAPRGPT